MRRILCVFCGLAILSVWGMTPGLADGPTGGMFVDVPTTHPANAAIRDLVQRGIILVGSGGAFSGDAPLLRYDAAQWVSRAIRNVEGTRAGLDVATQVTTLDTRVRSLDATLTREIAAVRAQLATAGAGPAAEAGQQAQIAFVLGVTGVVLALAAIALALW